MKIAVTGPDGFLAWHTRCALRSRQTDDVVGIRQAEFEDLNLMEAALQDVDVVLHLAGVNRALHDETVANANPWLASQLALGLRRVGRPISVVYANSIHATGESVFGVSKRKAAGILRAQCESSGANFVDVQLPNIFGEHGKPHYNSVVATFCHQLAVGEEPVIVEDRELNLLHAQGAAEFLLDAATFSVPGNFIPMGTLMRVSEVLQMIRDIEAPYREGRLPDLSDNFLREIFNTYRSFTFPQSWPIIPTKHSDDRGELVEAVRAGGGQTQVFFSSTNPGFTRGGHFHLRKVERFLVVEGQATIRLRRLFTSDVVEFRVDGETPAIIDIPTLWTHSITNTGPDKLITLFYADDEFNPASPDTYWVAV